MNLAPSPLTGEGWGGGEALRRLKPEQVTFARGLRSNPTDAERSLWSRLRAEQLGHRFRRQVPLGHFVADFVCMERRLIVEIDGGQHVESSHDAVRDEWLMGRGFRVIRFWNNDVLNQGNAVVQAILDALSAPPPQPSPVKGEGASP